MLDICSNLCHTINMTYTRDQLITALSSEYDFLCSQNPQDDDLSSAEFLNYLNSLSVEQLIDSTDCDETYTLDEFMATHYG